MSIIKEHGKITSRFDEINFGKNPCLDMVSHSQAKIPKICPISKTIVNFRALDIYTGFYSKILICNLY